MRVQYPDKMVPHLAAAMRSAEMPPVDRLGLLSDAASLCRAGRLRPSLYLELLSTCAVDTDPVVIMQGLKCLASLAQLLGSSSDVGHAFTLFARSVVLTHFATLGWVPQPTDGHLTRRLRATVLELLPLLCCDETAIRSEARRRFAVYATDPNSAAAAAELPAELQAPVFRLVLAAGGDSEFEMLLRLSETLELDVDRNRCLASLGAAPTAALRQRALNLTLGERVKAQDIALVPAVVHSASEEGRWAAWEFFKGHHERYQERAGGGLSNLMDSLISACCAGFCSTEEIADVEHFFAAHPFPKNATKVTTLLEGMRTNLHYLQRLTSVEASVLPWLQQHARSVLG